jgi:Holliday junction DNA helicase RuvA
MIAFLRGSIVSMKEDALVLDVGGVGYKVFVSSYTSGKVAGTGGEVSLHVFTYVREDILALYGFLTAEELEMFELLISVSGIGPKAGLGILSIADPHMVCTAILDHDASVLTRVSGVGKKTAERVILDLENKVGKLAVAFGASSGKTPMEADALDALVAMGYAPGEARDALRSVPESMRDIGDRVKYALKQLGT